MTARPAATPDNVRRRLRHLLDSGRLDLVDPGSGSTSDRWMGLFELARQLELSLARLAEAHVDAVGILHEAGLEPAPHMLYGVWASVGPGGRDVALDGSSAVVTGDKPFCSGIGVVDRALVETHDGDVRRLVEVDIRSATTVRHSGIWTTPALAATFTGTTWFRRHPIERTVGPAGWYLDRVGFWHGACGPAACWAGGAVGLLDRVGPRDSDHGLARYGAMAAEAELLRACLQTAGGRIDAAPTDRAEARVVALATRYAVHESATRVLDHFGRANGPRPLIEPQIAQRYADTILYLRQFHADADLVALAKAVTDNDRAEEH